MVIAVCSGERIAMVLPELGGLFRHPLMTVAKVRLCKRDGQVVSRPETLPGADGADGPAGMAPQVKLTVYTSEAARVHGEPAHRAIVRLLRSAGVSGATSHRGSWGFHGEHAPHGGHFPRHGHHVPVVTTVIDRAERIGVAFDVIDALTRRPGDRRDGAHAAAGRGPRRPRVLGTHGAGRERIRNTQRNGPVLRGPGLQQRGLAVGRRTLPDTGPRRSWSAAGRLRGDW